jgi:hypothetical protein
MESFSSGLPGKMGTNAYSRQIGPGWQTREVSPFKSDRLNQRVYWGCLQSMGADLDAHEWLKGHCITPKPNPAWVATQARYILGAPCTACSPLDWSEESLCPRQVYHFHNLCVCVCGGGVPQELCAFQMLPQPFKFHFTQILWASFFLLEGQVSTQEEMGTQNCNRSLSKSVANGSMDGQVSVHLWLDFHHAASDANYPKLWSSRVYCFQQFIVAFSDMLL